MEASAYRKNVMKTLSVKPAKMGLSLVAKNTEQTNVAHAIIGFASEVGELRGALRPFILGEQLSKLNKTHVTEELGDCGYYLTVLAKVLKVKQVSGKKKIKLQGTILTRIEDFSDLAINMLDLTKKNFYGPKMHEVEKDVRNPATGEITKKLVAVVDPEAQKALVETRKELIKALLVPAMELHAELSLALLGHTTNVVNAANIEKLSKRYPEGFFVSEDQEDRDTEQEHAAIAGAVAVGTAA